MTSISGKLDLQFSPQLAKTLATARNSVPDRGLGLTSLVIKSSWQREEEEITRVAEEWANNLMGGKVDKVV